MLEAKKIDLPEQDINEILEKINRVPEEEDIHERRPRRAAAIKASQMRQQLIEDDAL